MLHSAEETYITRDGRTMHGVHWRFDKVEASPCDRPKTVAIALHGWLDNAASFDLLAPLICNGVNNGGIDECVALDLAGHGMSDHLNGPYHPANHVADVVDILFQLGWFPDENSGASSQEHGELPHLIVIGHSMGGGIAAMLAGSFTNHIKALIMIEAIGPWPATNDSVPNNLQNAILDDRKRQMQVNPKRPKRIYSTALAAAQRRAQGNRVGTLPVSAALVLCSRGLRKLSNGFTWSADSALLGPTRMKLSPGQAMAFIRAIQSKTLVVTVQDGIMARFSSFFAFLGTMSPWNPLLRVLMKITLYALRLAQLVSSIGAYFVGDGFPSKRNLQNLVNAILYGLGLQDRLLALKASLASKLTHIHLPNGGGHHPHLVVANDVAVHILAFLNNIRQGSQIQ